MSNAKRNKLIMDLVKERTECERLRKDVKDSFSREKGLKAIKAIIEGAPENAPNQTISSHQSGVSLKPELGGAFSYLIAEGALNVQSLEQLISEANEDYRQRADQRGDSLPCEYPDDFKRYKQGLDIIKTVALDNQDYIIEAELVSEECGFAPVVIYECNLRALMEPALSRLVSDGVINADVLSDLIRKDKENQKTLSDAYYQSQSRIFKLENDYSDQYPSHVCNIVGITPAVGSVEDLAQVLKEHFVKRCEQGDVYVDIVRSCEESGIEIHACSQGSEEAGDFLFDVYKKELKNEAAAAEKMEEIDFQLRFDAKIPGPYLEEAQRSKHSRKESSFDLIS